MAALAENWLFLHRNSKDTLRLGVSYAASSALQQGTELIGYHRLGICFMWSRHISPVEVIMQQRSGYASSGGNGSF